MKKSICYKPNWPPIIILLHLIALSLLLYGCSISPMPVYSSEPAQTSIPNLSFTCYLTKNDIINEETMTVRFDSIEFDDPILQNKIAFNLILPDDFEWLYVPPNNKFHSRIDAYWDLPYVVLGSVPLFQTESLYFEPCDLALSIEDGYVYMMIHDSNIHIFGSVNPEATPEEIKEYFADFLGIVETHFH